jgi:glycosyltransferase involved in cell wall biosynthesis
MGAGSRVRFHQFAPYLESRGWRINRHFLLDDERYLGRLYAHNERSPVELLRSYSSRLGAVLGMGRHDVVWIEKELWPLAPGAVELAFLKRLGPAVVDYDDATFHWYDDNPNPLIRKLLGRKVDRLMAGAAAVIAGNDYLAERARASGAPRVEMLPSVVDVDRYRPEEVWGRPPNRRPVIGWIGSPSTAVLLSEIAPALAEVCGRTGAELRLMGSGEVALPGLEPHIIPWTEEGETGEAARLDIGIMPLWDTPFTRGKCGYKLVQYMAAGLPVVASDVGANSQIVEHGVTGLLVRTHAEWVEALERLIADPGLRRRMGEAGRERAEARFSTAAVAPRFEALLRSVAAA